MKKPATIKMIVKNKNGLSTFVLLVTMKYIKQNSPDHDRKRNEEICEEGRIVAVPVVLEPVPVHDHPLVVPVKVRDVAVITGGPLT